jgi:hypothetical protein
MLLLLYMHLKCGHGVELLQHLYLPPVPTPQQVCCSESQLGIYMRVNMWHRLPTSPVLISTRGLSLYRWPLYLHQIAPSHIPGFAQNLLIHGLLILGHQPPFLQRKKLLITAEKLGATAPNCPTAPKPLSRVVFFLTAFLDCWVLSMPLSEVL